MNSPIAWNPDHIQQVNNFLIIKGSQLFSSNHYRERVYRACYALPSDPGQMDDWVSKHLDKDQVRQLYEFIFPGRQL